MVFIIILNGAILAYAAQKFIVEQQKLHDRIESVAETMAALDSGALKVKKELETIQNQFGLMSVKLNEIENRKEPIVAFRVTSMQNFKSSKKVFKNNPGN